MGYACYESFNISEDAVFGGLIKLLEIVMKIFFVLQPVLDILTNRLPLDGSAKCWNTDKVMLFLFLHLKTEMLVECSKGFAQIYCRDYINKEKGDKEWFSMSTI